MCNSKFSKSIKYSETAIRLIICIAVVATIAPPQRNNNSNNSNSHSHLGLAIITIIILEMKVSWVNLLQKNLVVVLRASIIEGVSGVIVIIKIILPTTQQELSWTVSHDCNLGFHRMPDRTNKISNYNNKISSNINNLINSNLSSIINSSNSNILPFNLATTAIGKKISRDSVYSRYISLSTI